jgi:hypothetical protein
MRRCDSLPRRRTFASRSNAPNLPITSVGNLNHPAREKFLTGMLAKVRHGFPMCRAIKTLHNFSPPATNDEIRASSLQFVRKLSGFTKPSKANEEAFNRAVDEVAHAADHLLESLVTNAPPRSREIEAMKAKARSAKRFALPHAHNGNGHRH